MRKKKIPSRNEQRASIARRRTDQQSSGSDVSCLHRACIFFLMSPFPAKTHTSPQNSFFSLRERDAHEKRLREIRGMDEGKRTAELALKMKLQSEQHATEVKGFFLKLFSLRFFFQLLCLNRPFFGKKIAKVREEAAQQVKEERER